MYITNLGCNSRTCVWQAKTRDQSVHTHNCFWKKKTKKSCFQCRHICTYAHNTHALTRIHTQAHIPAIRQHWISAQRNLPRHRYDRIRATTAAVMVASEVLINARYWCTARGLSYGPWKKKICFFVSERTRPKGMHQGGEAKKQKKKTRKTRNKTTKTTKRRRRKTRRKDLRQIFT